MRHSLSVALRFTRKYSVRYSQWRRELTYYTSREWYEALMRGKDKKSVLLSKCHTCSIVKCTTLQVSENMTAIRLFTSSWK